MKGSYGSSRAYEIKIISGGEVHNIHVNEWGFAKNPKTILCLHGFTQCSLDFSVLASFFSKNSNSSKKNNRFLTNSAKNKSVDT